MSAKNKFKMIMAAAASLTVGLATIPASPARAEEYSFTVTNNTKEVITKLWGSASDGSMSGEFKLSNGIQPGKPVTIYWAEHTSDTPCTWSIKAGYKDGSESASASFDFCKQTDLVFNE